MPATGFLLFSADFPDFKFEEKLDASASRDNALNFLFNARNVCWAKQFDFAPIDRSGIEKLALSYGSPKNVSQFASILEGIKPGVLEGKLRQFVKLQAAANEVAVASGVELKKPKGDPVDFAFSYFIFCLWKSVFPKSIVFEKKGYPTKKEVRFAANLASWIAVKKVDLEKAEAKEVLFALAGIFNSLNRKVADFAAENPDGFESFVSSFLISFPIRKSFAKIPPLLQKASLEQAKIPDFSGRDALHSDLLKQSFFLRCLEHAGFPPFVSLDAIAGVYPELKVPKPRGNFGGKKKK